MPLDRIAARLRQRIPATSLAAFLSCFLSGYLIHLFAFTNLIPNSDGLSRVFDPQQMTVSGRWFLHYASALNGFTQMPALIGFLSMVFLSLAAAAAVLILGLHSRTLSALAGVLMAAFPCLGYTFLYMFTASAYCLAILLAVLSVHLAQKGGWPRSLAACLLLALSMGIYQAYAAVAISLSVLAVLRECLDHRADWKGTLHLGLRLMGMLAAGAALYYGLLQLFLSVKGLELLSYLGMSQAGGGYPIAQLPHLILSAYKQVLVFFFLPGSSSPFTTPVLVLLDLLALALGALFCFTALTRRSLWKQPWRPVGGLVMVALLPLAAGFAQIIAPFSDATPIMKYAYVSIYLAVVLAADLGLSLLPRPRGTTAGSWAVAGCLVCLCLYGVNINNLLYTASAQAHRATLSYATRLLSRIESCPGYTGEEEVIIIGSFPTDRIYASIESYALVDHYSVPMDTVAPLNKHIYYYLNDWLNVPLEEPDEETMKSVSKSAAFRRMPLYPADGSVQRIDGRIVVKIQKEYTPKSDYELAYENRS
ncbi:MAG: glucosyltransferase domain-containing protein [Oscillospiraceae bacterium]|jgi:hypothetical protein|nr:glucosyltransferase domain-containing protein [Oscillospiraceae bacterium]